MKERIEKFAVMPFTISSCATSSSTAIKEQQRLKKPPESISRSHAASVSHRKSQVNYGNVSKRSNSEPTKSLKRVFKENEMQIGYPTDVKHVAHIGWDSPTVAGRSWMKDLRTSGELSSTSQTDFEQPRSSTGWIHDATSVPKWTSQGLLGTLGLPPDHAPPEFNISLDTHSKAGKSKALPLDSKPARTSFRKQNLHIIVRAVETTKLRVGKAGKPTLLWDKAAVTYFILTPTEEISGYIYQAIVFVKTNVC
eukprot:Gb_05134 [translate_table: standard]